MLGVAKPHMIDWSKFTVTKYLFKVVVIEGLLRKVTNLPFFDVDEMLVIQISSDVFSSEDLVTMLSHGTVFSSSYYTRKR